MNFRSTQNNYSNKNNVNGFKQFQQTEIPVNRPLRTEDFSRKPSAPIYQQHTQNQPLFYKEITRPRRLPMTDREIIFLLVGFFCGLGISLLFCTQITKLYMDFLLTGLL